MLDWPQPPVAFGGGLAGLANAAIDISDGLLQDLSHILKASGCAAVINYPSLPVHPELKDLDAAVVQRAVLNGGDVYQLCFTAAPAAAPDIQALAALHGVHACRVGKVQAGAGLTVQATPLPLGKDGYAGFDHFG